MLRPRLRVASRTSSFQFKGRAGDVREIGRGLSVGAVLEGSVRKAGERVRITAQLVSPGRLPPVVGELRPRPAATSSRSRPRSPAAPGELRVSLSPQERELIQRRGTQQAEAYDLLPAGPHTAAGRDGRGAGLGGPVVPRGDRARRAFRAGPRGNRERPAMKGLWRIDMTQADGRGAGRERACARARALHPGGLRGARHAALDAGPERRGMQDFEEAIRLNPASFEPTTCTGGTASGGVRWSGPSSCTRRGQTRPDDYQALRRARGSRCTARSHRGAREWSTLAGLQGWSGSSRSGRVTLRALQFGAVQAARRGLRHCAGTWRSAPSRRDRMSSRPSTTWPAPTRCWASAKTRWSCSTGPSARARQPRLDRARHRLRQTAVRSALRGDPCPASRRVAGGGRMSSAVRTLLPLVPARGRRDRAGRVRPAAG